MDVLIAGVLIAGLLLASCFFWGVYTRVLDSGMRFGIAMVFLAWALRMGLWDALRVRWMSHGFYDFSLLFQELDEAMHGDMMEELPRL